MKNEKEMRRYRRKREKEKKAHTKQSDRETGQGRERSLTGTVTLI